MEYFTSAQSAHTSLAIAREGFAQGKMKMKSQSYSAEQIFKAFIDHLSRTKEESTPRQMKTMRTYEKGGCWIIGEPLNVKDSKRFYKTFNDLFFKGVLHEMPYALFLSYQCACSKECIEIYYADHRTTGSHGISWLKAAHTIERGCRGEDGAKLFNVDLTLFRLYTVAYYIVTNGIELPGEPNSDSGLMLPGSTRRAFSKRLKNARSGNKLKPTRLGYLNRTRNLNLICDTSLIENLHRLRKKGYV